MARCLLTGAGGFGGAHILEHLLSTTDWDIVGTDSFRHKGKTDRISEVLATHACWPSRVSILTHDLTAPFSVQAMHRMGKIDYVLAVASESHVDRSISDPVPFARNNVDVILNTLEFCREARPQHVIVISTDEVYGPEPLGNNGEPIPHPEWAPILPSNPYSASKACQEAIAFSYWRTYGIPLTIVNCMNLIGERQDPEKFVPKVIKSVAEGATLPVHGRPGDIGTRHYLHARNLADALVFLLRSGPPPLFPAHAARGKRTAERPDRWNVVGPDRIDNLTLAGMISEIMRKPLGYKLVDFHSARPGHDAHYGLDPAKLTAAGWKPPVPFAESLQRTVHWTLAHPHWML